MSHWGALLRLPISILTEDEETPGIFYCGDCGCPHRCDVEHRAV